MQTVRPNGRLADCKSAIQQIENLRYNLEARAPANVTRLKRFDNDKRGSTAINPDWIAQRSAKAFQLNFHDVAVSQFDAFAEAERVGPKEMNMHVAGAAVGGCSRTISRKTSSGSAVRTSTRSPRRISMSRPRLPKMIRGRPPMKE